MTDKIVNATSTASDEITDEQIAQAIAAAPASQKAAWEQAAEDMKIKKPEVAAEISKEANQKILALVPQEWIKRIPFFVRNHATTKTCARIAEQYPELYAIASQSGELPVDAREQLSKIVNDIFEMKMNKHNL